MVSVVVVLLCLMTSVMARNNRTVGNVEREPQTGATPNVLFIALDDMNDWTTLFDKDNPIQTPNLERLAARGTFFENAYCAAPACAPSRAAIMTGRAPHESGVYKNGHAWAKMLPDAEVVSRWFMAHGYDTRAAGKIFHHGRTGGDPEDKPSFQQYQPMHKHAGYPGTNYNGYTREQRPLQGPAFDWGEHNVDKHNDEYTVEWGADVMAREWKEGMKPQFLALGIFRPHLPFWAPSRSFKNYPSNKNLVMPHRPDGDLEDVSPIGYRMTLKERFFQDNVLDQPDFSPGSNEQLVRCYQAASTFADEMVGRILDTLDATGQADNTIIVLWSDHGYHLGDKECYVKFTMWEKANHVPFIIVAPGVTTPGTRCKAPVSLLDIYPTLLDVAGLPPNPKNDGVSLRPLLEDPNAEWNRPALMTYGEGNHAIRTPTHRYIRYEDGSEELYTHVDNWNVDNLAGRSGMVPVLAKHRRLLDVAVGKDGQKAIVQPASETVVDEPPNHDNFDTYLDIGYDQSLRPQFHFTSRKNWLNDPNGMVYYDGEWHMYFQHVAIANNTGPKSWGSAVSTDLMHWEQLPHAITPYPSAKPEESDKPHTIWSGSAVVDELNALGKQKGDVKTLYAIYTATHRSTDGKSGFFQAAAYSTDRGRTWTKLNGGGPMIDHQVGYSLGQRDPRIFYYAPGKYYVVIMMVGGAERAVRLWKSTDLMNWEIIGDIPNKAAECIDMYTVAVDGDPKNMKWVIADAGTRYEVGDFDGRKWKGSNPLDEKGRAIKYQFDYGDSYYAAQAFNQGPNGRVVHIGWLRSKTAGFRPFLEAGMPFTQQMSVPAEITLRTTADGIRMFRNPVKEIETLYRATHRFENLDVQAMNKKLQSVQPELVDLTLAFNPEGDLSLNVRGLKIAYDAESSEVVFENRKRVEGIRKAWKKPQPFRDDGVRRIPAPLVDGKVTLRVLVDRASLELFVNDGQAAASFVVVPAAGNRQISVEGSDNLQIDSLVVNELQSIWNK